MSDDQTPIRITGPVAGMFCVAIAATLREYAHTPQDRTRMAQRLGLHLEDVASRSQGATPQERVALDRMRQTLLQMMGDAPT